MADDQQGCVSLMIVRSYLVGEFADSVPSVLQRFAAGEFDVDPSAQVLPASVELGVGVADLFPRHVFVVAEIDFSELGAGLDLEDWPVSGDRFSGIDGSLKVAGVDGVEIGVRQSLGDRFRLESSGWCERHVEVALGLVVQVALSFTVTNHDDGARRRVDDKFWCTQVRVIRGS